MDKRIQKSKKTAEGDIINQRKNTSNLCEDGKSKKAKPGRRQIEKAPEITHADHIKIAVEHFFGGQLNQWLGEVDDPRIKERCTYSAQHLFWLGILMFVFRLGSRRQLSAERNTDAFHSNLLSLSNTDEELVASTDAMNYFLEKVEPENIELVKMNMARKLIADKRLDGFRLDGKILVAVDGTQLFSFKKQHCESCLKTEHEGGTVTWNHKILEAKIVADIGLSLSICSEPIENFDGSYDKQDCELKAFYRLAKKLKKHFSHTRICLLLDGLYACREVFDICRMNQWNFIVVFKKGSIPLLYDEAIQKRNLHHKNFISVGMNKSDFQNLSWAENLVYHGNTLHAIFCEEHVFTKGIETITNWEWLTNIRPRPENIQKLVNKGGRQRWKIENQGFNEQKRHDFELEHLYGEAPNAWKNYYQLLQIAHMITQLITHGDLCRKLQAACTGGDMRKTLSFIEYYQSVRNFIRRLTESFRNRLFTELAYSLIGKIQIRFSSA